MSDVREPAVSGTFYPNNPDVLKADIDGYLSKATLDDLPDTGSIVGMVAPHAGYMYSGQVAAYAYKAVSGNRYDTVVIMAPSHQSFFFGAAIQDKGAYKTPLGIVPVDEEIAADLVKNSEAILAEPRIHRGEHSIEVHIPFLQTVLGDFKIVPLVMGMSQDAQASEDLASLIYERLKLREGRYLVVGSTDLSHYYPYDLAVDMDKNAAELLQNFDVKGLSHELATGKYEACGAGPMISTMVLSQKLGATRAKVLKYMNSGDVTGDMSSVVGYVSCVFY